MITPVFKPLKREDKFQFACHSGLSCFNQCCQDLTQALTPYDVIMIRSHLKLSWQDFIGTFATEHVGPATGLPVVSLRFDDGESRSCPFVTDDGCRIYTSRPSSCRLYPLARALYRSREDGSNSAYYTLVQESHCRGFERGPRITIQHWIDSQNLEPCFTADDLMFDLITLKNKLGKGPLPPRQQQWVKMALYDLDMLKEKAVNGDLDSLGNETLCSIPKEDDDTQWLTCGMEWIKHILEGLTFKVQGSKLMESGLQNQSGT